MKILAIETATEACSAALLLDAAGDKIVSRFQLAPREHTRLILPMMQEVLGEANLELSEVDAIAFSRGPGAFTGLRIAAGVAQGVAVAIDKPVIPVSTLAALALQAYQQYKTEGMIFSALDARMGEVYWGCFDLQEGTPRLVGEEQLGKPEQLLQAVFAREKQDQQKNGIIICGSGWDAYHDALFSEGLPEYIHHIKRLYPGADAIAKLAASEYLANNTVTAENAQPVYLRDKVAKKSKERAKNIV